MNTLAIKQYRTGMIFRAALFFAASSLAVYITYKFAMNQHAVEGMYGFMFPLSGVLALAGMIVAIKPMSCDCSIGIRSGVAGLAFLWAIVGMMCSGALLNQIMSAPLAGSFATLHMLTQHVFLSVSLIGFAMAPAWMLSRLGIEWSGSATATSEKAPTSTQ